MPIIVVYGVPHDTPQEVLEGLARNFIVVTVGTGELSLTPDDVSVFFNRDVMSWGIGEEIIVFVEGLFDKPERTDEVCNRLAERLGTAAKETFPAAKVVECFVKKFKPTHGFWTSKPEA